MNKDYINKFILRYYFLLLYSYMHNVLYSSKLFRHNNIFNNHDSFSRTIIDCYYRDGFGTGGQTLIRNETSKVRLDSNWPTHVMENPTFTFSSVFGPNSILLASSQWLARGKHELRDRSLYMYDVVKNALKLRKLNIHKERIT